MAISHKNNNKYKGNKKRHLNLRSKKKRIKLKPELKVKNNIAILIGGESAEQDISKKSGVNFNTNLNTKKYSGYLILVSKKNWKVINTEPKKKNRKRIFENISSNKKLIEQKLL